MARHRHGPGRRRRWPRRSRSWFTRGPGRGPAPERSPGLTRPHCGHGPLRTPRLRLGMGSDDVDRGEDRLHCGDAAPLVPRGDEPTSRSVGAGRRCPGSPGVAGARREGPASGQRESCARARHCPRLVRGQWRARILPWPSSPAARDDDGVHRRPSRGLGGEPLERRWRECQCERRGVRLGNPNRATAPSRAGKGGSPLTASIVRTADRHTADLAPELAELRKQDVMSLGSIAAALNERGKLTRRGGRWHVSNVRNLPGRLGNIRKRGSARG